MGSISTSNGLGLSVPPVLGQHLSSSDGSKENLALNSNSSHLSPPSTPESLNSHSTSQRAISPSSTCRSSLSTPLSSAQIPTNGCQSPGTPKLRPTSTGVLPASVGVQPPTVPGSWKTHGYRVFSNFIASEQTFFMVRRFGALNVRAALALQDEVVLLEETLEDMERFNTCILPDPEFNNGSFRKDQDSERKALIKDELIPALTKYNNFINSCSELFSRRAVGQKEREQVDLWLRAHPRAIDDLESGYVKLEDDLISVQPKDKSWFRKILEWTFVYKLPVFRRRPQVLELVKDEYTEDVVFPKDERLERCSSSVIAVVGLGMLIGPLWILEYVTDPTHQLGVITGFIALFFVLVAVATNARIFDSLAAAAAYSAVLMVFLQLGSGKAGG